MAWRIAAQLYARHGRRDQARELGRPDVESREPLESLKEEIPDVVRLLRVHAWVSFVEPVLASESALGQIAAGLAPVGALLPMELEGGPLSASDHEVAKYFVREELRHQARRALEGRRLLPPHLRETLRNHLGGALRDVHTALVELVAHLRYARERARELTGPLEVWSRWGHPGPLATLSGDPALAALFDCVEELSVRGTEHSLLDALEMVELRLAGESEDLWLDQLDDLREFITG